MSFLASRPEHWTEGELVAALRDGDERAFLALVDRHHASLVRLARAFVREPATADELVHEAWTRALAKLDRLDGEPIKIGLFRLLIGCAGPREQAAGASGHAHDHGDGIEGRFLGDDHPRWSGGWASPPLAWPEARISSPDAVLVVKEAIESLPLPLARVLILRDVEGFSSGQVGELLEISESDQRRLLHCARSKVRAILDARLTPASRAS